MSQEIHIGISYQEDISQDFIDEFSATVSDPRLQIKIESRSRGFYASIDWALPTLVIAYLAKPYFEGFLQEAGKDHYQALKKGILQLTRRLYGKHPEHRDRKRSLLFSTIVSLQDGRSLKFVFPEGVSLKKYEVAVDSMYRLLSEHFQMYPSDSITEIAENLSTPSRSLYFEFDPEQEIWMLLDPLLEAQVEHAKQKI
ncbi:hypothetical protein [Kushneria marisflavi]|uniref:Uncharacterized protein n=1 Tax=Kushneria marisflavi TaxID=157779 RepID=A0A240US17_9GAMM|nr:hypothetical protein [Kushneria marisflavi]ART63905.1 hypothetical protein B9H00_13280 [Kushneria marisflavi]RKD85620.1 hypothetical protein C8D96_1512 [Kushneria marisflavi]